MSNLVTVLLTLAAISAGLMMLISSNWRWTLSGLAIQYLVAFLLVAQIWPIGLAAIKLVAGWIAGILLALANISSALEESQEEMRSVVIFRGLSALLLLIIVFSITPTINLWIPIPYPFLLIGLLMISLGLLHFGISQQPLRVILGLLTLLIGFEIIYSALEGSALLAAILAAITIALGMLGSYFFTQVSEEDGL